MGICCVLNLFCYFLTLFKLTPLLDLSTHSFYVHTVPGVIVPSPSIACTLFYTLFLITISYWHAVGMKQLRFCRIQCMVKAVKHMTPHIVLYMVCDGYLMLYLLQYFHSLYCISSPGICSLQLVIFTFLPQSHLSIYSREFTTFC